MNRTFDEDLRHSLEDPESVAYFAEAQIESAKELLKAGIITSLNIGSQSNKTTWRSWNEPHKNSNS